MEKAENGKLKTEIGERNFASGETLGYQRDSADQKSSLLQRESR